MNAGGFHASFLPGFAVLARRSSFVFGGSAAETRTRAGNPSSCALGPCCRISSKNYFNFIYFKGTRGQLRNRVTDRM